MKKVKITPPEGYEIDKQKSTFDEIVFKKIDAQVKTWREIQALNVRKGVKQYCLDTYGDIDDFNLDVIYNLEHLKSHVPDKRTAERIRALCQMYIIAEHYNDGWRPNWNSSSEMKFTPSWDNYKNKINTTNWVATSYGTPVFKSSKIMLEAYENNKEIFETALKP